MNLDYNQSGFVTRCLTKPMLVSICFYDLDMVTFLFRGVTYIYKYIYIDIYIYRYLYIHIWMLRLKYVSLGCAIS